MCILRIEEECHDYIFDEIFRRYYTLEHESRAVEEEE
jgi:hypothetical protein